MIQPAPPTALEHSGTAIRYEGRDVLSVLHRISTAALEDLHRGEARAALFCDFRARLLHRAAVACAHDGGIWVVRADAPPDELLAHVDRHVFREDVRVMVSAPVAISVTYGPQVTRGSILEFEERPVRITLVTGETFEWAKHPATIDDTARIRAGLPRHGCEIRDAFHPFEVGLASEVHLSKGCYTGQEVLQRLITYGSVRRSLMRVSGGGARPVIGAQLLQGGEPLGVLTSVAPDRTGWIALAVAKQEAPAGPVDVEGVRDPAWLESFPDVAPQGLP